MKWDEGIAASLMRHFAAWSKGEDIDPENGAYHDTAILWNAMALVTYRLRGIGEDDRPKLNTISDDVPGHPIKRDISDPVVPVTTPDYPIPGSASDYVPDVVRPDNHYSNTGNGRFTVVDPGSGHVK